MRPCLAMTVFLALASQGAMADEITVFAASSLKTALDGVAAEWQAETGNTATIAYGGSSALAKQIEQGAPADVFVSASKSWMDALAETSLIHPETRRDILGNTLVLIAHGHDAGPVDIAPGLDLRGLLGDGKLAMALVDSVPAGQYGKEALQSLGIWAAVEGNVAQSENVRAALALVASGEAPYGIVYASDAIAGYQGGDDVTVVGTFPEASHKPIVYPAAVTADTALDKTATSFVDFLSSDAADAIFGVQGFVILN